MTAQAQLAQFIGKYSTAIAREARAALRRMRELAPGANELVYDTYNWLVIGFCPANRPSDAVMSLVLNPGWLTLCFLQNGPELRDPERLLRGSGRVVRHVRLASAKDLDTPGLRALIREALARADVPIDPANASKIVIRSVSGKQRNRRRVAARPVPADRASHQRTRRRSRDKSEG